MARFNPRVSLLSCLAAKSDTFELLVNITHSIEPPDLVRRLMTSVATMAAPMKSLK